MSKQVDSKQVDITVRHDRRHEEGMTMPIDEAITLIREWMNVEDFSHLTIEIGNQE